MPTESLRCRHQDRKFVRKTKLHEFYSCEKCGKEIVVSIA